MKSIFLRGGWLCLIGVGLIVAAAVLWLSLGALQTRLLADGIHSTGVINGKEIHEVTSGMRVRQRRTTRSYFVNVTYGDGDPLQTQLHQISEGYYEATTVGSTVPVIYLSDRPEIVTLEDGRELTRESRAAFVFATLGVLMIVLGLYLVRFFTARADLHRIGVPVTARVTKLQSGNGGTALTYAFDGPDGKPRKGTARRRGAHWQDLTTGSPIAVIHHPTRPKLHMLEMDAKP